MTLLKKRMRETTHRRGCSSSRVAIVVPDFDPSVGGTTRQSRLQAEALQRRGHLVVVVSRRRQRSWNASELVDGLEVVRIGPPGRGPISELFALAALGGWLARNRSNIAIAQVIMWPDA